MESVDTTPSTSEAQAAADKIPDALLVLLAALPPGQQDHFTRVIVNQSDQMQPTQGSVAASSSSGNKAYLQDLMRRLTGFLRQLADFTEGLTRQSATKSQDTLNFVANSQPQDISGQEILARLTQALAPNAPQTVSDGQKSQTPALPDFIYFTSRNAPVAGAVSSESSLLRAVSLRPLAGSDPIESLQKLVEKLRRSVSDIEKSDSGPSLDPSYRHFILARLDMPQSAVAMDSSAAASNPLLDPSSISSRTASIQQIQAAIADMVDRLQGDATLDSKNMRAVIHLDPPALGRLHVDLRIDDTQRVSAHIAADNAATQDFLKQRQHEFHQNLNRQGFRDDQIDLRFSDEDGNGFDRWIAGPARIA